MLSFPVSNSAETSGSWDLGLIFEGARNIGDTVFYDLNMNGLQDAQEVGIPNVDLTLYLDVNGNGVLDATDFPWSSQTTDVNGHYLFTNLASAVWFVVVDESDIPSGYRQTADPDQQGVVATAGDGMGTVTLGTNDVLTVDFGYASQGSGQIGDRVFVDADGDGHEEANSVGIANVRVWLYADSDGNGSYETLMAAAQTDADGMYLFTGLPDGSYRVVVDENDPDIPVYHTASTLVAHAVTLADHITSYFDGFATYLDRSLDADFGFTPTAYIGDFVFYDANTNGTQEAGEEGIPNVTLRLYDSATDALLATTNTATGLGALPKGYYQFMHVPTGTYYVVVDTTTLPTWNGSPIPQTADPDRDGVPVWDTTTYPGLPAGDNADTGIRLWLQPYIAADFGYQPFGVIGDYVWRDLNGNGVQDKGETGVANVLVTATQGATTVSTYTDGDGYYNFANLADGSWTVAVAATNFVSGGPLYSWADTYDADGGLDHSTVAIISDGVISSANNAWTTKDDASLDVDFGFNLGGDYALSGTCASMTPPCLASATTPRTRRSSRG